MIDPKLLRQDPDLIRRSLTRRGSNLDLDALIELESSARAALSTSEQLRSQQKDAGRRIASLSAEEKELAIREVAELATAVKEATSRSEKLAAEFQLAFLDVPNLVADDAADGFTEEDSVEIKRLGEPSTEGATHVVLGEALDIIDMVRGSKVSGARFGYLKGKGAILELSLVRWAMDHLVEAGFIPMIPPVMVREEALVGTGFFPEAREQVYEIPKDELFLVGTAEVPMAAYHGDEIFNADELPIRVSSVATDSPNLRRARA